MPRFAVIGDPVLHSASPRMFEWLAARLTLDLTYAAIQVTEADLPSFLDEVRAGQWDGVSVTLPHKEQALALSDERTAISMQVGATNCISRRPDGKLVAHNTDVDGVVAALAHHGVPLHDARWLLLGAGGAARAAATAAHAAGPRALFIANRKPARALTLAKRFGGTPLPLTRDAIANVLPATDILVQATPAGLASSGVLPEDASALPVGCVLHGQLTVMDMVYQPLWTRLLRDARSAGARPIDGLWMLVFQGLAQLRLWMRVEAPQGTAEALHAYLAEPA